MSSAYIYIFEDPYAKKQQFLKFENLATYQTFWNRYESDVEIQTLSRQ
jgi:hypothetical protein